MSNSIPTPGPRVREESYWIRRSLIFIRKISFAYFYLFVFCQFTFYARIRYLVRTRVLCGEKRTPRLSTTHINNWSTTTRLSKNMIKKRYCKRARDRYTSNNLFGKQSIDQHSPVIRTHVYRFTCNTHTNIIKNVTQYCDHAATKCVYIRNNTHPLPQV